MAASIEGFTRRRRYVLPDLIFTLLYFPVEPFLLVPLTRMLFPVGGPKNMARAVAWYAVMLYQSWTV